MKRFQSIIQNYITNHQKHKKYLAAVLALSVLVSFGVSAGLIMPAVSWTGDDVVLYNDNIRLLANENAGKAVTSVKGEHKTTDVVLLAGNNTENPIYANSVEEVISKADNTYALGIASQFCVFLQEDFTEWQADAEGRVAVGGDAYFKDEYGSYAIAKGDYNNSISLQKLLKNSGFAGLILGGAVKQGRMDDAYYNDSKQNVTSLHDGDSGKIVDINKDSLDANYPYYTNANLSDPLKTGFPESSDGDWKKVDQRQLYVAKLFDFNAEFEKLNKNSKQLSATAKSQGISITEANITTDDKGNKVCIFDANMLNQTQDTVYFNVSADVWDKIRECTYYKFEGIPNLTTARAVVDSEDAEDTDWELANIIINIEPTSGHTFNVDGNGSGSYTTDEGMILADDNVYTSINGISVSDGLNGKKNNDVGVTSLLWNIYSENEFNLKLGKNFQGTILAPNARVTDGGVGVKGSNTNTAGHLSGALIAKSFNGGTEFGYRPYLGDVSILGGKSGYGVPIKKLIDGTTEGLEGATFGIFEEGNDTAITTFTSDSDGNAYVNIESKVDFTGGTDYKTVSPVITKNYVIKEVKAPAGFVTDNTQKYEITVKEIVDVDSITNIDGKNIPTKVTTEIKQGDKKTFKIVLHDIYSYEGGTYKRIMRELEIYDNGMYKDTFQMQISDDGKVTSVRSGNENGETITQNVTTDQTEIVTRWKTESKDLPVYTYNGTSVYKLDKSYASIDNKLFIYHLDDNGQLINAKEQPVKYEDENNAFVDVSGEIKVVEYVDESGTPVIITDGDEPTPDMEDVTEEVDTIVYKLDDGTIVHKNDAGEWLNDSNEVIDVDGEEPTLDMETWEKNNNSEKTAYEVKCVAWGGNESEYPKIDSLTFYYQDGTSQTIDNVSISQGNWWHTLDISSLTTTDVIGVKAVVSEEKDGKLCIQYDPGNNQDWANIPNWGEQTIVDGKIRTGVTPTTHTETKSVQKTQKISVQIPYEDEVPVLRTNPINLLTPINLGDLTQAQNYTSGSGIAYKYDPETVMMMPQPASNDTKTFTNKRGLIFRKVSQLGADKSPLKGATINVNQVDSKTLDIIGNTLMSDILDGDSETTIDVSNLSGDSLYCFVETATPDDTKYETADPIYFKKSGDTIYYTQDAEKAKSGNTEGWDKVDITIQQYIEMVDIQISGAKIKLGKYKYADGVLTNDRLSATFQLWSNSGDLIYPLPQKIQVDGVETDNTFTIPDTGDFDLFTVLKNAKDGEYNTDYVQNGYLIPGRYELKEIAPPAGYNAQDFSFRVKVDNNGNYTMEAIQSGAQLGDPGDMYISTENGQSDGNPILVIKGTMLDIIKANPDEVFVENLGVVDQMHVSKSGSNWNDLGGAFSISNLNNCTFNEILKATGKSADEIKFIRFIRWSDKRPYSDVTSQYYTGAPSGASGSGGATSYNINKIVVDENTNIDFDVIFYYQDKDPITKTGCSVVNDESNKKVLIDISGFGNDNRNNVIGIKVKPNSSYNGQAVVQKVGQGDTGWDTIWNTNWGNHFSDWKDEGDGWRGVGITTITESEPTQTTTTTPADQGDEIHSLTLAVNDDTIKIPNQKPGTNINITVEKVWAGDTGFKSLRPDKISVTLKRKNPDGSDDNDFSQTKEITEGTDGKWTTTFTGLQRLVNPDGADEENNWYKYYVVENTSVAGYSTSYSDNNKDGFNAGGTITITNTLGTTQVNVIKKWYNGTQELTSGTPDAKVKLQWKKDGNWIDLEEITLNSDNEYKHTFTGLPAGKEYQVIESQVPTGWKLDKIEGNSQNGYTVINKRDNGSLTIKKNWTDNNSSSRPNDIWIAVYRTTQNSVSSGSGGGSSSGSSNAVSALSFDPNTTNVYPDYTSEKYTTKGVTQYNDYARLLQYSLYFYDANMCGDTSDSEYSWRTNCHETDTVKGGFHDAGDYVMFGLPQGYSASTLGWSVYEFRDSYDDLGLTSHIKTISEHFADFLMNCYKEENNTPKILYQKGYGKVDHRYWGLPESQSDRSNEMFWTSEKGPEVAAEYAAALALHYLNFGGNEYLERAKDFYNYSTTGSKQMITKYENGTLQNGEQEENFYGSDTYRDDQAWAAAWLYVATKNDDYKKDCIEHITAAKSEKQWFEHGYLAHQWNNVLPAAEVVASSYNIQDCWNDVKKVFDDLNDNSRRTIIDSKYYCFDNWGSIRYNLGYQLIALAAKNHNNSIDKTEWCKEQMAYILGENNLNKCFITGFASNSPVKPHYRATAPDYVSSNSNDYIDENTLVGAVVGGPNKSGFYDDIRWSSGGDENSAYAINEVALDYNANLVMAAAGLYHFDKSGFTFSNVDSGEADPQALSDDIDIGEISFDNISVDTLEGENTKAGKLVATYEGPYYQNEQFSINPSILNVTKVEFQFIKTDSWGGFSGLQLGGTGDGIGYYQGSNFDVNGDIYSISLNGNNSLSSISNIGCYGSYITNIKIYADTGDSFTVVPASDEIYVGESINLTITGAEGNINWDLSKAGDCQIDGNALIAGKQTSDSFTITGTDEDGKEGKFTIKVKPFTISADRNSIKEGETVTITAVKNVPESNWTIPEEFEIKSYTENSITLQAGTTTGNDLEIKAEDNNGNTATVNISITGSDVQVMKDDVNISGKNMKIRKGSDMTVKVSPSGGVVSANSSDENVATVSRVSGNDYIIRAVREGETTITFTRNGNTATVNVNVLGDLIITGQTEMNKDSTQTLAVENAIGTVTWSIESEDPNITIDSDGKVNSEGATIGSPATVTAEDEDNATATFQIFITLTAVSPDIPEGLQPIMFVKLNKDNNWQKTLDLPKTDENGHTYYYYIAEVKSDNKNNVEVVTEVNGNNGAKYLPVNYDNGKPLDGSITELSVTNEKKPGDENQTTMPSAGGNGTDWYYITGTALMLIPAVILMRRRRKST